MAYTFDRKKDFSAVVGDSDVAFIQQGRMFDKRGNFVRDCPPTFLKPAGIKKPLKRGRPRKDDLDTPVKDAEQEIAKENAQSLRAEEKHT